MGRMKEWGMQIAKLVYEKRLSDSEIIRIQKHLSPSIDETWLKEQIKAVRENPKMWRGYAGRS